MKRMNKKSICLAVAALLLVSSLAVGSAIAYFTAIDKAAGAVELDLGFTEAIPNEVVQNRTKTITITNNGNYDCYVRLRALTGNKYDGCLKYEGADWTNDGDYYYYGKILNPGAATSEIVIDIKETFDMADSDFNVIVIQECTPVLYDADGNPKADWDVTAIVNENK